MYREVYCMYGGYTYLLYCIEVQYIALTNRKKRIQVCFACFSTPCTCACVCVCVCVCGHVYVCVWSTLPCTFRIVLLHMYTYIYIYMYMYVLEQVSY